MSLKILILGSLLLVGCETYEVKSDVPCPARPILEAFVDGEIESMTREAQGKIARNQIKLKQYAKKLEVRAFCE